MEKIKYEILKKEIPNVELVSLTGQTWYDYDRNLIDWSGSVYIGPNQGDIYYNVTGSLDVGYYRWTGTTWSIITGSTEYVNGVVFPDYNLPIYLETSYDEMGGLINFDGDIEQIEKIVNFSYSQTGSTIVVYSTTNPEVLRIITEQTYTIDWGDGFTSGLTINSGIIGDNFPSLSHTYTTASGYTISISLSTPWTTNKINKNIVVPAWNQIIDNPLGTYTGLTIPSYINLTGQTQNYNYDPDISPSYNITGAIDNENVYTGGVTGGINTAPISGYVFKTHYYEDGKILMGGFFTGYTYSGVTYNRRSIVRINKDGSVDDSFQIGTGFYDATNSQKGIIYGLLVDENKKIYVGGFFTDYNGTSIGKIVRLNDDGTIDNTFVSGTGFDSPFPTFTAVWNMKFSSFYSGKIYVMGYWTTYNGNGATRSIIRLNSDGTMDTSFASSNTTAQVLDIAEDYDGKLYVLHSGTNIGGATGINRISKLNTNGTRDSSFNQGTGMNSYAMQIMFDYKRDLVVIGGLQTTYKGVPTGKIFKVKPNGDRDTSFNSGTGFVVSSGYTWEHSAMYEDNQNRIIVAGPFVSYRGNTRQGLFRIYPDGSFDNTFNRMGELGYINNETNLVTRAFDIKPSPYPNENGILYISAGFADTKTDGGRFIRGLVKLNPNNYNASFTYLSLGKSRISEKKLYGSNTYAGVTTGVTEGLIYSAYTIDNLDYRDYTDGYTLITGTTSGFTKEEVLNTIITRNEHFLGFVEDPEIYSDIFVERGKQNVAEKNLRLSEIDNIGELSIYGNGYFNIRKQ
jgi:uncharacterized delta-60 repeat protein